MEPSKTVSELKSSFIRDQIRILSAAQTPSPNWRDYGARVDEDITDKAVEDVLQKLNTHLRHHNRAVFSSQAVHHVARQIESLYWNSINDEHGDGNSRGQVFEKGTDWTDSSNISRLPDEWADEVDNEEDKTRFEELHKRLLLLDSQRQQQQKRLAQYRQLQQLLEPFRDPQTNIQPNLATRDSQISQELDRMRMLLAKVTSRLSEAKNLDTNSRPEGHVQLDPDEKLSKLLDMT